MAKDIYIELLEDITGITDIAPDTPILQRKIDIINGSEKAKELNNKLKASCKDLREVLRGKDMSVGSADGEGEGYTEPCPIQYTGNISEGEKFENVFLGLNPYREPPRMFPKDTTFADLANFHHPHDIRHGKNPDYYAPPNNNDPGEKFANNYWRVLGNKEGNEAWSSYYQPIIRTHIALLRKDSHIYNSWKELQTAKGKNSKLTKYLLDLLRQHPIANIEMVPFKTEKYSMKNFTKILESDKDIAERYNNYLEHIFKFIDDYSESDAYIIVPTNLSQDTDNMTEVYKVFEMQVKKLNGILEGKYFVYSKKQKRLMEAKPPEREKYELTPCYLANWTSPSDKEINRKVIITPSVSGQGQYTWMYNFSNGWITTVRKYFHDEPEEIH